MSQKKFTAKEWGSFRKRVLLKIYNYFNDLEDIKNGLNNQNMKEIVFNYLSSEIEEFSSLDAENYTYFESSIYAIYLFIFSIKPI